MTVDWSRLRFAFETKPRTRRRPPQRHDDAPDPEQRALLDSLEPSLFDAEREVVDSDSSSAERPEWRGVRYGHGPRDDALERDDYEAGKPVPDHDFGGPTTGADE